MEWHLDLMYFVKQKPTWYYVYNIDNIKKIVRNKDF